jgi:ATP-dependent exoDNAse (exonuclease V) alpha subunit
VHERQQIEVASGDRLLLTGNRGDAGFRATNGELVKVRDVDGGRIHLEDGRTLPANYHEFDHGYAVTAHRSQGKTVDAVILSADAMKQELFYVGASRGRQEIVVVTSDREQLRNLLGISTARPSATELATEQTQRHSSSTLAPEQPSLQTIEPSMLRKMDGRKHDLGMSR